MKFNIKENEYEMVFERLFIGDVFMYGSGVFIKTREYNNNGFTMNTFNLNTTQLGYLSDSTVVRKVRNVEISGEVN